MQQTNSGAAVKQTFARRRTEGMSSFDDIELDLARLVFRNVQPTVIQGSLCFVGLNGFLAYHYGDRWFAWMTVLTFCVCLARLATVFGFLHWDGPTLSVRKAWQWQQTFGFLSFVYCSTLAACTLHSFRHHDPGSWAICGTGVFAVSANQGGRLGLRPAMSMANALVMQAALAGSLLLSPDLLVRLAGGLTVLYAVFHCTAIRSQFVAIVDQIRSHRKLVQLAERDTLTGLVNRRHFQAALTTACQQPSRPFAILYIDLDRFKAVNDTFGHATGDVLLVRVAERLQKAIRSYDVVARLGGDEFAVLQQAAVTVEDAQALASRIVRDLSDAFEIEGRQISIGASIGVRLSANDEIDPLLLLSKADHALYRVKQSGGGGFALTES